MRTFFEILTAQKEVLSFEVVEVTSTGYTFKNLQVTVSGLTSHSKAILKGVARKYEATVSETSESELSFVLAVEQEDTAEDWLNAILEEYEKLCRKYK